MSHMSPICQILVVFNKKRKMFKNQRFYLPKCEKLHFSSLFPHRKITFFGNNILLTMYSKCRHLDGWCFKKLIFDSMIPKSNVCAFHELLHCNKVFVVGNTFIIRRLLEIFVFGWLYIESIMCSSFQRKRINHRKWKKVRQILCLIQTFFILSYDLIYLLFLRSFINYVLWKHNQFPH